MKVVYFTAGSVGAGHAVRGLALGRALSRIGFRGDYLILAPALTWPALARSDGKWGAQQSVAIQSAELLDAKSAERSALAERLSLLAPDLLIVDLFWAPLRWILPQRRWPSWLLVRRCPPAWFVGPKQAAAPFSPSLFARALAIEPGIDAPIALSPIPPLVICNRDECRPRGALRQRLAMSPTEKLTVIAHAGRSDELARIDVAEARRFDLHAEDALFPLAEWLDDADEIHTGAGYNSFWESRWLGRADRTRFTAFPRTIDDQQWRIAQCADHAMSENGADVLARMIAAG